ncbi:FAD-dependent oxidoreductase [Microvirga tunisiensis]|uniref:FAD-dependent oxidoreductase n=1 Tax=Pannonibacter tanglangensis TaxID=2750084 RepID=A0A7X5J7P4_9HYPH|nr:FAD-binding oxidoreductase [Pannonibacter sp. XCT-53]NBN76962.1 FAD-dependent oxidoreductase [Pannonibacter sp. XCT-53]
MIDEPGLPIGSYWEDSVGPPVIDPQLETPAGEALAVDLAVVGAGYTGLNAALRAVELGASVAVLERHQVGYGASGRNGGFCCIGGSKRSPEDLVATYGEAEAQRFVALQVEAIEHVARRLDKHLIAADQSGAGELVLAHKPSALRALREESAFVNARFGLGTQMLTPADLAARGLSAAGTHGGMLTPHGFGLNPLKYVRGLARALRDAEQSIFGTSPVLDIVPDAGRWRVETPKGRLLARRVILAGNGYLDEDLLPWVEGRLLPVLSNVMVTRVLTQEERMAQGWTSPVMSSDSRTLLHYFRLLPDGRMLFGMRGGIFGSAREANRLRRLIRSDFEALFPALAHVETTHYWSGRVCLALDLTPYIGSVPGHPGVFAALAYHGNGVAMGSMAGTLAAELALDERPAWHLPLPLRGPLRRFPLARLRRHYLQAAYWWYGLKDRLG